MFWLPFELDPPYLPLPLSLFYLSLSLSVFLRDHPELFTVYIFAKNLSYYIQKRYIRDFRGFFRRG